MKNNRILIVEDIPSEPRPIKLLLIALIFKRALKGERQIGQLFN